MTEVRMHARIATLKAGLAAICLLTLCGSAEASDDCSVADVLVNLWIRMARTNVPAPPTTKATRRELEFEAKDQVVLKGYSYSVAPQENEAMTKHFILLLQGSASSAAQLAETASGLALATKREVFVYEYRGYAPESTVHPTAASIQQDIDAIIDTLAQGGRRGVVIGLSLGGVFAIQSLKRPKSGNLRALVDSVPAQVPWIPFLLNCPRWMNPLDAATLDVVQRLGVLYGTDDGWSRDSAAKELMEKVQAGGGRVWMIKGRHVDLSAAGLAVRLPIYVDFVEERAP
jgi:alpha-beta hydrolase superfamily lysophospholipase